MLDKKGLSVTVEVLLLVSIVVVIAGIVFVWAGKFVSELSPPVDCSNVGFEAEIFNENGEYFLSAVNIGDVEIKGIILKLIKDDEIKVEQDFDFFLGMGNTETFELDFPASEGDRFLVVPKISVKNQNGEDILAVCSDNDGYETQYREISA